MVRKQRQTRYPWVFEIERSICLLFVRSKYSFWSEWYYSFTTSLNIANGIQFSVSHLMSKFDNIVDSRKFQYRQPGFLVTCFWHSLNFDRGKSGAIKRIPRWRRREIPYNNFTKKAQTIIPVFSGSLIGRCAPPSISTVLPSSSGF